MSNLNLKNRTIFCKDNLDILQGINSNCVDLIYLDPPFNKNKKFTAPIGSSAEGAEFSDIFREADVKDEWLQTIKEDYDGIYQFLTSIKNLSSFQSSTNKHYLYNYCYLCYMAIRLIEMQRILKDTGSIYLHCDPTMSHYLKILMDLTFGEKNFKNEISFSTGWPLGFKAKSQKWVRSTDILLFYCKTESYYFEKQYSPYIVDYDKRARKDNDGRQWVDQSLGKNPSKDYIKKMMAEGRAFITKTGKYRKKQYIDEMKGMAIRDFWDDIDPINSQSKEKTGYPTQKPLALLERIIQSSSNEGDVILDPFCGCATTCVASEKLKRQWIGVDISIKAYDLVRERLKNEVANPENIFDYEKDLNFSAKPPKRTDTNGDERPKKYIYIISNEQFGANIYKIGIAKDYKSRFNSYQTSDPFRAYKLKFYFLTPYYREIEKYIHKKFNALGEWVHADLENIKKEIKNYKI